MNNIKKLSFLTSLLLSAGILFTGCGEENGGSVKFEYGNDIKTIEENLPFSIDFDSNFLTDEEASAIVNYYYAITENDEELAKSVSNSDYMEYLAEISECETVKDFLIQTDNSIGDILQADDYTFSHMNITSCYTEKDTDVYTYFDVMDEEFNEVLKDNGVEDIISKIESRKLVSASIDCEVDGNEVSLTDIVGEQQIYLYTIEGKVYVL